MKKEFKNSELFNQSEFLSWSRRANLICQEQYLIEKYILQTLARSAHVLDVGTGNGIFLSVLAKNGFSNLTGIDLAEKLLSYGKRQAADHDKKINFLKMDASVMGFGNNSFQVVLGLQQIISFISPKEIRRRALAEVCRVLAPGGIFLSSFLHFHGRWYNPIVSMLSLPVKILKRDFKFLNYQYLPWLKHEQKSNIRYLIERQSYVYWYQTEEILKSMEEVGFMVRECVTSKMILENRTDFLNGGMLYIVAQKPERPQTSG
jgi:ubiquinone/menaquinone biosynthesis C-methylase UbiE